MFRLTTKRFKVPVAIKKETNKQKKTKTYSNFICNSAGTAKSIKYNEPKENRSLVGTDRADSGYIRMQERERKETDETSDQKFNYRSVESVKFRIVISHSQPMTVFI